MKLGALVLLTILAVDAWALPEAVLAQKAVRIEACFHASSTGISALQQLTMDSARIALAQELALPSPIPSPTATASQEVLTQINSMLAACLQAELPFADLRVAVVAASGHVEATDLATLRKVIDADKDVLETGAADLVHALAQKFVGSAAHRWSSVNDSSLRELLAAIEQQIYEPLFDKELIAGVLNTANYKMSRQNLPQSWLEAITN